MDPYNVFDFCSFTGKARMHAHNFGDFLAW